MNVAAVLEHSETTYHAVLIRLNTLENAWVPAAVNIAFKLESLGQSPVKSLPLNYWPVPSTHSTATVHC